MDILRLDPAAPDSALIQRAAAVLRGGGLVAFPTETVYGLGADALDPAAVRRIFEAKGRPGYNPLIVHVPDSAAAKRLAADWPEEAERLAAAFWPGALTLVLPKRPEVPDEVTAGLATVALRVPAHGVALALLRAAERPLAAPSANRSGELSPTRAAHVAKSLGDRVDLILDAGPTEVGIESTVVSLAGERPALLRAGGVAAEAIERVVGPLASPSATGGERAPRPSPGMLDRHYAPRAELRVFEPEQRSAAAERAANAARAGKRVGALLLEPLPAPLHRAIVMPTDPSAYAARLYASLHELDDAGCELILAEAVPASPAWSAVRDRLRRAAAD